MPKVIKLNGSIAELGKVVELREMTVAQWLESTRENKDQPEDGLAVGLRMLAKVLYVDGDPIGWDKLSTLGMSDVRPALDKLNELLESGDEGNG